MWTKRLNQVDHGQHYCLRRRKPGKCCESLLELYHVRRWRHRWKVVRVKENFDGYLGLPRYHAIPHAKDEIASLEKAGFFDRINMLKYLVEELDTSLSVTPDINERS